MTSKYRGVLEYVQSKGTHPKWLAQARISGKKLWKTFEFTSEGERQAAKCVDVFYLKNGKNAPNILKPKNND